MSIERSIDQILETQPFIIITGPNGSGKSTILKEYDGQAGIFFKDSGDIYDAAYTSAERPLRDISLDRPVHRLERLFRAYLSTYNSRDEHNREIPIELKKLLDDINKDLHTINYKYSFNLDFTPDHSLEVKVVFPNKPTEDIKNVRFSSGEIWMLAMIISQYDFCKPTAYSIQPQIKCMVLDEPDKHLDPKSCKQFLKIITDVFIPNNIKVIMTTHRIDTVALADDRSLFTLKNDILEPTHKVLALSRLSTHLQQLMGLQIKVYVEALDDQIFYEGIYANLMQYRQILRDKDSDFWNGKSGDAPKRDDLDTLSDIADLSMRYPMSFYPTVNERNRGGYSAVNNIVKHSHDIGNHLDTTGHYQSFLSPIGNLFRTYKIDTPLGIIDMDDGSHTPQERIIILTRHSVENFICDPMFFHYLFGNDDQNETFTVKEIQAEVDEFFENLANNVLLEYKKHLVKQVVENLFNQKILRLCQAGQDTLLKPVDILTTKECVDLQNKLIEIILQRDNLTIQSEIGIKELVVGSDGKKYVIKVPRKPSGTDPIEKIKTLLALEDLVRKNKSPCAVKILMPDNSVISLEYPEWFLKGKGHDIYDVFAFDLGDFRQDLFNILSSKLIAIPLHLIEILTNANKQIVEQVRNVIKPGVAKKSWLDKKILPTADQTSSTDDYASTTSDHRPVPAAAAAAAAPSANYATEDRASHESPISPFTVLDNTSDGVYSLGSTPDSDMSPG